MATRSRRAAAVAAEAAGAENAAPAPAAQRPETLPDEDPKADPKATVAGDGKAEEEGTVAGGGKADGEGGDGLSEQEEKKEGLSERQVARVLLAVNVLSFAAFIGCVSI